jgi:regulator of protease activity HflC (stomatin/prohibitin superfamily)
VPQIVEIRVRHEEVPHETCITQDNVQIDVDFVFYWQIKQPEWSLTRVTDPVESIRLLATAILRAVIAHYDFNDVQTRRESINDLLKVKIDEISSDWGVFVTTMEIREVKASIEIVKAMEKRRAAEWESEAIETLARGQAEALKTLFASASQIDNKTLNLKYFEMLQKLGEGQSTKYIFPMELSNLVQSWIPQNRNKSDQSDEKNDTDLVKNNGAKSSSS